MGVHKPSSPISKLKKKTNKMKEKIKQWVKSKKKIILISLMVEPDIPNIQIQVQVLDENIPIY